MNGTHQSFLLNSSTTSSIQNLDVKIEEVRNEVKMILKSRIFLGRYLERRLVDQRIGYRDIVKLSPAEVELKRDLLEVQYKLQHLSRKQWIGISESETIGFSSGVCIWTEIDNQPFGVFWFQIKSVKFRDFEVIIILKCLRHITDAFLEVEPICSGSIENPTKEAKFNETMNDIVFGVKNVLTLNSLKEFITFLIAFVIAIVTGSNAFVQFLGNFILALVRELSNLISKFTPIILGCLDFFSKVVGGFYILIAMMFKPNNTSNTLNKRTIAYNDKYQHSFNDRYID